MLNSGASTCFVCNLPILNHQVGLVWQGGNGVDDFLREQMEMDIIRGRLGNTSGRRNSCAQITTIDTVDDLSSSSQPTSKRRRSSLAQLTELLKDWGIRDKEKYRGDKESSRRGTLADLGRSFGGRNKKLTSTVSIAGPPPVEPDFMSKIRKRRETSADITVLRKGSGTVSDIKSDISRFLSQHRVSSIMGGGSGSGTRSSDHHLESSECTTSISSVMCDDFSNSSRRGSEDTQPEQKRERSGGPLRIFKRKESRGNMSPMTPESDSIPSFTCVVRMPSNSSPIDVSNSPSEPDSRSDVTEVNTVTSSRRDSLKPLDRPEQFSPTSSRRGIRRQATAFDETSGGGGGGGNVQQQPLKSGGSSMTVRKVADLQEEELEECENLWSKNYSQEYLYVKMTSRYNEGSRGRQRGSRWPTLEQLRPKLKKASLMETSLEDEQIMPKPKVLVARKTSLASKKSVVNQGTTSRRGSRPFLSPDERPDLSNESSLGSGSVRSTKSARRDSLSPDSANEEAHWRMQRRDSRPLLSPEPDAPRSRDGSPRRSGGRGIGRRRSSGEESCKGAGGARNSISSAHSSREHSPKAHQMRRQSTTEEILIARGFRRESTTEDIMRCRNFRRQSTQLEVIQSRRGRRDSCTQITDGTVGTMIIESEKAICDSYAQTAQDRETSDETSYSQEKETPNLYENNHYHEECLKCNSCGMNLSGPNQKRARRFKNQILCDLHFADMALMESSDFMQQLRNFKPQSLGCAVARRKSSTTLIFPLPPQACSDEFCDGFPHNLLPTPGYWIECSRAISNQGSAWTNEERDLQEIDEGITDSPDGSLRDAAVATEFDPTDPAVPRIREPKKRKTPIEEQWEKYGSFGLTSVEQETHEKYFYGTEHWNYFTNDEDLGPVILSLKQETINGRDQFRVLVRAVSYTIHGLIPASCVFADRYNREEVVASLGREINLNPPLTLGQLPDTSEELLKLDQVFIKSELKVGVIYVKENQYTEEEILDNNEASPYFEEFLQILGEKVRLKGFDRYKGGLDTVHDLTGLYSVFTHWRSIEIMFHVSTLLPHEENDPQKLQRKRHIGNDIVCVVFLEADNTHFSPSCIKSHFLHTFIVVRTSPRIKFKPPRYEISVVTRDEVGAYKPYLWEQSVFTKGPMLREWILTKIVNGERASYSAPKFARMQERTRSQMLEDLVANLQNHAETGQIPKPYRRGSWRPIGHMRPSSPLLDSVRDLFEGQDQLARDFTKAFSYPKDGREPVPNLFDIAFIVGQGKVKTKLYGVRALLGVRSRVFQEMLYGISTGFGSPQVPVAEILARAAPSPPTAPKPKSSNFLQVPDIEGPRPKSVPNSPSIPRAFSNLRHQLTSAWSSSGKKKQQGTSAGTATGASAGPGGPATGQALSSEDRKKWPSSHDCAGAGKSGMHRSTSRSSGWGLGGSRGSRRGCDNSGNPEEEVDPNNPNLAMPRLSVCADSQKVDRAKLSQTEFPIIEFDGETFRILLTYLHSGSCPLSCLNIPGLICAAEHYDLPELLQACFHHAKQFIRVDKACQMLNALENYYWRYCSASELVNMILAFIETRALAIFGTKHFLELSESMVQLIMNRNLEVPEIAKFEAMLRWAKYRVSNKRYSDKADAKIEFRCCMDRLTRDLKLYRISPQDLIKTVIPSKAVKNEKIMETLMVQANSGMYRVHDTYFEECKQKLQRQDSKVSSEWDSFDMAL